MVLQNEYKLNIVTSLTMIKINSNPYFSPFRLLYGKVENFIFSKIKTIKYTLRGNTICLY